MIKEIVENNYHLSNQVWTSPNSYTSKIKELKKFDPKLGWSSGPSALTLASSHNNSIIYILGFDFEGVGENKKFINNIYAGSKNYKKNNDPAIYYETGLDKLLQL
jgi:hypothetical protein